MFLTILVSEINTPADTDWPHFEQGELTRLFIDLKLSLSTAVSL